MRTRITKDDYVGFTFNGIHTSQLGLLSVANGDRYSRYLFPQSSLVTSQKSGMDQTMYFGKNRTQRTFSFNIAFDDVTEQELREIRQWLDSDISKLILDEQPYIYYNAVVTDDPQFSFVAFTENNIRLYKGEFAVTFTCYDPYGYCDTKWLANYVYENPNEWAMASGLKETNETNDGNQYDVAQSIITSVPNFTKIYLYNGGDLPTDFTLSFPSIEASGVTVKLYKIDSSTLETELISEIIFEEGFEDSTSTIIIDTKRRLILKKYIDSATNIEKESIITDRWTDGNFFQIPVGEYQLWINNVFDNPSTDVIIDYQYKYL